jgi:hypothetical protein
MEVGSEDRQLARAFTDLMAFLDAKSLTASISNLEARLVDQDGAAIEGIARESGLNASLLYAAMQVRSRAGRISDIIHAATIAEVLPRILERGERLAVKPSLAAGNDPSRPFDIETNLRVAEFKVSVWKGADAMRKRGAFADLVHLALDESDRRAQLFVVPTAHQVLDVNDRDRRLGAQPLIRVPPCKVPGQVRQPDGPDLRFHRDRWIWRGTRRPHRPASGHWRFRHLNHDRDALARAEAIGRSMRSSPLFSAISSAAADEVPPW